MAHWGDATMEDAEFDMEGNLMPGPKTNIPKMGDSNVYQ
jgi:hypothetical protein